MGTEAHKLTYPPSASLVFAVINTGATQVTFFHSWLGVIPILRHFVTALRGADGWPSGQELFGLIMRELKLLENSIELRFE